MKMRWAQYKQRMQIYILWFPSLRAIELHKIGSLNMVFLDMVT
jgi:hypothetical protein